MFGREYLLEAGGRAAAREKAQDARASPLVLIAVPHGAGRLVWLQGLQSTAYAADATSQRLRTTTLVAPRGEITDRSGQPLAQSVEARAVYGGTHG